MTRHMLVILLLGGVATSQSAQSSPAAPQPVPSSQTSAPAANVEPDTPVITINGVCDHPSGEKPGPNCKTVITRAKFEAMVYAVQPSLPASSRREFAQKFVTALIADEKARELGLEHGEDYDERTKVVRMQALAQELNAV